MNTIELKRGDTLDLKCTVKSGGAPMDITGWLIACWVRDQAGNVLHRFEAGITSGPSGEYSMLAETARTALWPEGGLSMDIRYTDAGGRVFSTATVPLQVLAPITELPA